MMKNFGLFCAFAFLLTACKGPGTGKVRIETAPVEVEIVPASDTLDLKRYFAECDRQVLRGRLLAEVLDVKFVKDGILVQSKAEGRDLHLFDLKGAYIRSLIRYGRAEDEVLNLQAFCYNAHTGTVDVLCNYGMEIRRYGLDGTYRKTVRLPEASILSARDLEAVNESTYLLYKDISYTDSLEYKLYLYDSKTDSVLRAFIPIDKATEEKISFGQVNNLYARDGKFYFYEVFQNGIYEVTRDEVRPYVAFAENSYTFPAEYFARCRDMNELIERCRESNCIWGHVNCIPCDRYICSFFNYRQRVYGNVIDIKRKESRSYLYFKDFAFSGEVLPIDRLNLIGSDRDRLICTVRSDRDSAAEENYLLFIHN